MRHLTGFLFLGTLACTSPDGELLAPPTTRPSIERASVHCATIGPSGGRVLSEDEYAAVAVPAGALGAEVEVCVEHTVDGQVTLTAPVVAFASPVVVKLRPTFAIATPLALALAQRTPEGLVILPSGADSSEDVRALVDAPGTFEAVSRRCAAGTFVCPSDGHGLERCVLDVDRPGTDTCGVACDTDDQCPAPLQCAQGRCALAPCTSDDTCTGRCVGLEGLGVCARTSSASVCRMEADCDVAEVCWAPGRLPSASAPGRCVARDTGCRPTTQSCALRELTAHEGFLRRLEGEGGPIAWLYGARARSRRGDPDAPYRRYVAEQGVEVWTLGSSVGDFAGQLRHGLPGGDFYPVDAITMVNDQHADDRGEPIVTLVRWIVPRDGTYSVEIAHQPLPGDRANMYTLQLFHDPARPEQPLRLLGEGIRDVAGSTRAITPQRLLLSEGDRVELAMRHDAALRGEAVVRWRIRREDDVR